MNPYQFCPQCAAPLIENLLEDRLRHVCPTPECGFVHWNNPVPVVAAVVEYQGRIFEIVGALPHIYYVKLSVNREFFDEAIEN